jgi:hypothetical protein
VGAVSKNLQCLPCFELYFLSASTVTLLIALSSKPPSFAASYRVDCSGLLIDEVSLGAVFPGPLAQKLMRGVFGVITSPALQQSVS